MEQRALNTNVGGPVGIWAWDSNAVTIQYNESYANKTGSSADGGGFDLDGGVHQLRHAVQLLARQRRRRLPALPVRQRDAHSDNIVRYNISQNDGRANTYGGIHVWGRVRNAEIYNNTIFMSARPRRRPGGDGRELGRAAESSERHFRNNIFVSAGAVPLVEVDDVQRASSDLQFQGNIYFAATNQWILSWGAAAFTDFASWRTVTLQEHVNGAAVGSAASPLLTNAGGGVRTRGRHAAGNARRLPAAARVTGDRRGAESGGVRHCDWRPRLRRHLAASRQRGRYRRRGTAICSEFARGFQRGRQT